MSNIDYKAEVLKVYPKAVGALRDSHVKYFYKVTIVDKTNRDELSAPYDNEQEAWQNAYEQLKKEGKIK